MKSNTILYKSKINLFAGIYILSAIVFALMFYFVFYQQDFFNSNSTFDTIIKIVWVVVPVIQIILGIILFSRHLPGKPMVEISDKCLSIHSYITNKWTDISWDDIVSLDITEDKNGNQVYVKVKTNRKTYSINTYFADTDIDEIYDVIWRKWKKEEA